MGDDSSPVIKSYDGKTFGGYLKLPGKTPAPGIILIQEVFGVNHFMRETADDLAEKGFTVFCPDLFWRQQPGVELTDQSQEEWDRAFALMRGFELDKGVADLISALDWLRAQESCNGKAGTVGYCLGGQLAYLMACRSEADASVGYYGVRLNEFLTEAKHISQPLMLHAANKDSFVSDDAKESIREALSDHTLITYLEYEDRDHAFARSGGKHYHAEDAALANQRTLDFFREHLSS